MLNVVMLSVVAPCLEYDSGIFKSFSKLGCEPGLSWLLINVLTLYTISSVNGCIKTVALLARTKQTFYSTVYYIN
jgi:hypothetical protein